MNSTEKTKDKTVGEKEKLSQIQVVEPDNSGFKRKETEKKLRGKVKDVQKLSAEEVQSRRVEQVIREVQEYAESIVATVREPLLVLGADLRVITANESFYRTFQVTPGKTENRLFYDIGDRQWDIPKLRELLEKILPQNTVFNDFEVEHDFPTIGKRTMILNARRIYREGDKTQTILLAIEDITQRRRMEEELKKHREHLEELVEERTAELKKINEILQKEITEREGVEEQIRERMKEMQAFFSLSEITEREGITLDKLYQELANILPISWKYAEIACARIVIGDSEFHTKNFTESKWMQSAPVKVSKTVVGRIDVGYLEERPEQDEGPFLKEERRLIDALAERLGHITERRRAEEVIWQVGNYNRSLIEASLDPLVTIGSDGKITDVNKTTEEATGTSREKLIGNDFSDYFTEPEKARAGYLKVLREGLIIDYPLTIKHASGKTIDVLYNAAVYRNEAGQVLGVFAAARDITKRKRAEEALSASEVRYRRLFETAKDGILILDAETGVILDVNPFLIEMLGLSHEQFMGKAIWEIGFFKDVASNKDKFLELQRQGYVRYEDLPLETADGRRIEVEFVSNVYTVDHQKVIQCNIRNITERKQAEETLKASETRYRRLFETAQDGILILGAKTGQITDVNPFLIDMLGYSHQEFVGKKLWDIGVFKDRIVCKKAFWELQTKGSIRYEDLPLETKDGQHIEVEFVSNVYQINGEEVIQCNIRNITDRKRFEAVKDDFVSMVSHELRTPLTSIREAVSQTLDGILGEVTEQQRDILSMALSDADRLTRIINDLLDVSKIEAGKMKMKIEVCEMVALVKKLISSFIPQAKAKGLEVEGSFSKEKIGAYVDRDRITQVFSNLIGNAVKFTQKGRIQVSLLDRGDAIECSISDTGPGIAKKDFAQLFDKFQQFGHQVNGEEKGTGLGLAVSKGIVELHRGRIWVESQVNAGTKFTFVLPKFTGKELISEGLKKAIKEGQPLSVLIFNIKNSGTIQKKMGEEKVGQLINDFWELIKENLRRDEDDLGIEGLHTILTILPGTEKESAASALERMSDLLLSYLLREKEEVDLLCEIMAYPDDGKTEEELFSRLENILTTKGEVEVSSK